MTRLKILNSTGLSYNKEMHKMNRIVVGLITLFLVLGCTKKDGASANRSAEEVVKDFVMLSASAKDAKDRKTLEEYCTGEMKSAFQKMTDEQFRIFYLNGNIAIQNIQVLDAKVDGEKATVRYQVSVENRQGTDITKEKNEREVSLQLADGAWRIEAIKPRGLDKLSFTRGMIF